MDYELSPFKSRTFEHRNSEINDYSWYRLQDSFVDQLQTPPRQTELEAPMTPDHHILCGNKWSRAESMDDHHGMDDCDRHSEINEVEHMKIHEMEQTAPLIRRPLPLATRSTRGLKYLSSWVRDTVIQTGATTYQNVASALIEGLDAEAERDGIHIVQNPTEAKNVRWRVYDALNVLIAAGVLRKNEKKMVEHNWNDPSRIVYRQ